MGCTALLILAIVARVAVCQGLEPVDISGFGKNQTIQASVADVSISVCKAVSSQDGALHHYDIELSGTAIFENHSRRAAILYKHPFVLTTRIGASPRDLASGRFLAGLDGDRMAISSTPKQVSITDFALIGPGKRYASTVSTTVPLVADSNTSRLQTSGKYWVQLGIDARPDKFYFEPTIQKAFARKWRKQGELVEFVLAKSFLVNITLDPHVPLCKE